MTSVCSNLGERYDCANLRLEIQRQMHPCGVGVRFQCGVDLMGCHDKVPLSTSSADWPVVRYHAITNHLATDVYAQSRTGTAYAIPHTPITALADCSHLRIPAASDSIACLLGQRHSYGDPPSPAQVKG